MFLARTSGPALQRAAADFPVVLLTGPRQSGKTTLLRNLFGGACRYVSVETPDMREAAAGDPRGFLDRFPPPVIFDEIQFAPGLLPYVKERVDARRDLPGQYFLTGSQNLLLQEAVTESLAGRVAVLRLLPLTSREIDGLPGAPPAWESAAPRPALSRDDLWRRILRGGYPELWVRPDMDAALWHASYGQTYLERDVRLVRQIADLGQFQSFLRALAARTGTLLDLTGLSRDLGIAVNTVKAWLAVLEATHQVVLVRPFHANVSKRLVKSPKVYFTDTGTAAHLAGLRDPVHAADGPMGGALFETAVFAEVYRTLLHRGEEPRLYFWRTATGAEVDFLVEVEGRLVPLEAKSTTTPRTAMAEGILSLRRDLGEKVTDGFVVHAGAERLPLAPGVVALPFAEL